MYDRDSQMYDPVHVEDDSVLISIVCPVLSCGDHQTVLEIQYSPTRPPIAATCCPVDIECNIRTGGAEPIAASHIIRPRNTGFAPALSRTLSRSRSISTREQPLQDSHPPSLPNQPVSPNSPATTAAEPERVIERPQDRSFTPTRSQPISTEEQSLQSDHPQTSLPNRPVSPNSLSTTSSLSATTAITETVTQPEISEDEREKIISQAVNGTMVKWKSALALSKKNMASNIAVDLNPSLDGQIKSCQRFAHENDADLKDVLLGVAKRIRREACTRAWCLEFCAWSLEYYEFEIVRKLYSRKFYSSLPKHDYRRIEAVKAMLMVTNGLAFIVGYRKALKAFKALAEGGCWLSHFTNAPTSCRRVILERMIAAMVEVLRDFEVTDTYLIYPIFIVGQDKLEPQAVCQNIGLSALAHVPLDSVIATIEISRIPDTFPPKATPSPSQDVSTLTTRRFQPINEMLNRSDEERDTESQAQDGVGNRRGETAAERIPGELVPGLDPQVEEEEGIESRAQANSIEEDSPVGASAALPSRASINRNRKRCHSSGADQETERRKTRRAPSTTQQPAQFSPAVSHPHTNVSPDTLLSAEPVARSIRPGDVSSPERTSTLPSAATSGFRNSTTGRGTGMEKSPGAGRGKSPPHSQPHSTEREPSVDAFGTNAVRSHRSSLDSRSAQHVNVGTEEMHTLIDQVGDTSRLLVEEPSTRQDLSTPTNGLQTSTSSGLLEPAVGILLQSEKNGNPIHILVEAVTMINGQLDCSFETLGNAPRGGTTEGSPYHRSTAVSTSNSVRDSHGSVPNETLETTRDLDISTLNQSNLGAGGPQASEHTAPGDVRGCPSRPASQGYGVDWHEPSFSSGLLSSGDIELMISRPDPVESTGLGQPDTDLAVNDDSDRSPFSVESTEPQSGMMVLGEVDQSGNSGGSFIESMATIDLPCSRPGGNVCPDPSLHTTGPHDDSTLPTHANNLSPEYHHNSLDTLLEAVNTSGGLLPINDDFDMAAFLQPDNGAEGEEWLNSFDDLVSLF